MSLNGSPLRLVSAAGITATAHAVTADGVLTDAQYEAAKDAGGVVNLGYEDGNRRRGGVLRPVIIADENDTAELKVWRVSPVPGVGVLVELLATVTVTAADDTNAYAAGALAPGAAAYNPCDTLASLTTTGLADALADAYSASISVYSPGSNAQGHLIIPDAYGAMDLLVTGSVTDGDTLNAITEGLT
jgi:hypothetical protein